MTHRIDNTPGGPPVINPPLISATDAAAALRECADRHDAAGFWSIGVDFARHVADLLDEGRAKPGHVFPDGSIQLQDSDGYRHRATSGIVCVTLKQAAEAYPHGWRFASYVCDDLITVSRP